MDEEKLLRKEGRKEFLSLLFPGTGPLYLASCSPLVIPAVISLPTAGSLLLEELKDAGW